MYDGFDPTGIAVVFAPTAAAARILKLTPQQTLHALALAFNRCGGSFQSNIDGSLAVRAIQGWVAETGVICAQMAQRGFTGPVQLPRAASTAMATCTAAASSTCRRWRDGLGGEWRLLRMMFKKYPSCGATQGMTELVLQLVAELDLRPEQVQRGARGAAAVLLQAGRAALAHRRRTRASTRSSARSTAWPMPSCGAARRCRTSASRRCATRPWRRLIERVTVEADAALDARGHTAVDVLLHTDDGRTHARSLDIAPGFPDNPLSDAQQRARFDDCMAYAPRPLPRRA